MVLLLRNYFKGNSQSWRHLAALRIIFCHVNMLWRSTNSVVLSSYLNVHLSWNDGTGLKKSSQIISQILNTTWAQILAKPMSFLKSSAGLDRMKNTQWVKPREFPELLKAQANLSHYMTQAKAQKLVTRKKLAHSSSTLYSSWLLQK